MKNKDILQQANAAVSAGDNEGFLSFCTEDVTWIFIGDKTISGKEAVRQYMAETYIEPPEFMVDNLIAEGDYVVAQGKISLKDSDGKLQDFSYCDVWRFRNGMMAELKAFVIGTDQNK